MEYIHGREGLKFLSAVILETANLGYQEKKLLIDLGYIYQLVCMILQINPSGNQIDINEVYDTIEVICILIRSTIVLPSEKVGSITNDKKLVTLSPFLIKEASHEIKLYNDVIYLNEMDLSGKYCIQLQDIHFLFFYKYLQTSCYLILMIVRYDIIKLFIYIYV